MRKKRVCDKILPILHRIHGILFCSKPFLQVFLRLILGTLLCINLIGFQICTILQRRIYFLVRNFFISSGLSWIVGEYLLSFRELSFGDLFRDLRFFYNLRLCCSQRSFLLILVHNLLRLLYGLLIRLLFSFLFVNMLLDQFKSFYYLRWKLFGSFFRKLHTVDSDLIVSCILPLLVLFLRCAGDFLLSRLVHRKLVWEGGSRRDLLHRLIAQKCRLHGVFLLLNRGRLAQRGVHFALGIDTP